jgi:flagellar assembly factor FliW
MVVPTYQPDIPDEDAGYLGLQGPEDACVLNIVTVSDATKATMNLKGPIVLNRRTLMAKQVIPANAAEYSVQHPLPVETN